MVEATKKKFLVKVVLLGDVNVGKTTLINRFAKGTVAAQTQTQATLSADFQNKMITVDGADLSIQMWDTAGQEKHTAMGYAFYRGSNCCILTFDISSTASFERIAFWKKNFLDQASPADANQFPFVVVGNKMDQERQVTRAKAETWCRDNGGYAYFETCATLGDNVEDMFRAAGTKAMAELKSKEDDFMPTSLTGASGAIKLDKATEAEAEEQLKKKKKKCKC